MKALLQKLALLVLAAGIAGILTLLVLHNIIMPRLVQVPHVTVPRLRGQSLNAARTDLDKWKLKLAIRDSLHHDSLPAGSILDQDPAPGQRIKRGRRIRVDVSLGPQHYPVPATIQGVSLRAARLRLEASQLRLGEIMYVSSPAVPQRVVIRSTPPPGTPLPRGARVDLEVSSGPADLPKPVPSLRGLPIEQVEDSLRKYEMRLGTVRSKVHDTGPAGIVLAQSPREGERAPRHTPVEIVISAAPAAQRAER